MKNLILLILMLTFEILPCYSSVENQNRSVNQNREILKEYFLYSCIIHGFEKCNIESKDNSGSVYVDILNYGLKAIQKTDSLAKRFIESIEISPYENRNTKGIIIRSIEEYKSKRLDEFIKSMDIYMIKD
jgi:hypothetical protein